MKRIALYTCTFLLATACREEFLDRTPQSALTSTTFYRTEGQFRQALSGAYQAMREAISGRSSWVMSEMRSDNTHYDYNAGLRGNPENAENVADFIDNPQNPFSNDKYYQCYTGIARTNTILTRLEAAPLAPDVKAGIAGEARFLRALYYFELVQFYGEVPLYTKEIINAEESYVPRAPVEEVYQLILSDAQEAAANLPDVSFPQTGRATKGAVRTLLAKVYMVRRNYAEAERELRAVTGMGYALLPDYAAVFDPANKGHRESILEVQYLQGNQGQQSNFIYYFIPATNNTEPITGIRVSNTAFDNLSGGWNVPTQEMIDAYEEGDRRLDASVAIAEGTGQTGNFTATGVASVVGYTPKPGVTAKPFIRKYLHPHSQPFNTNNNWPVYRYADVLLLLAEALNEQGKPAEALTYLNQVRSRAGVGVVTATDQAALREAIARERRVELAFENQRYQDLVRTGKAVEVLTAHGQYLKSLYPNILPRAYNVTPERLLFPIPDRERQINAQLTQNSGYN